MSRSCAGLVAGAVYVAASACGGEVLDDAPTVISWRVATEPSLVIGHPSGAFPGDLDRIRDVALLSDGGVAVADAAQRILIFASDGSYVRTIGRRGQGPGEFGLLRAIQVLDGDTILAFDEQQRRVSFFDREGALLRTIGLERFGVRVGRAADGTLVFAEQIFPPRSAPGFTGIERGSYNLLHLRADGEVLDTIAIIPGYEVLRTSLERLNISGAFLRDASFAFELDEIFMATSERFEITAFGTSDPHPVRTIRPTTSASLRPVGPGDVDQWYRTEDGRSDAVIGAILAALPSGQTLPMTLRVLRDDAGWVWLEHYPPDGDPPLRQYGYLWSRTWSAMDPDGEVVVDVEMPPRFQPFVIGQDFVLGVSRDSLDVQWVHEYALERGP